MMHIPPQHNTEDPPGQYTNPIDMSAIPKKLGDIIDKIKKEEEIFMNGKKKLSFEEWYKENIGWNTFLDKDLLCELWYTAQENK